MLEIIKVSGMLNCRKVLEDVSLSVPEHSIFMLMGPTGCGKTTLLKIAALHDRPDYGEVIYKGSTVSGKPDISSVRREIALMTQHPVLFRGTVRSNIEWALKARRFAAVEIRLRLDESLKVTGLEGIEERNTGGLSGGEMQRTALARVIALRPELLLLDEPAASLDPCFRIDLLRRLKAYAAEHGITVIMTTHSLEDALSIGTCGAIMNNGRIEQTGQLDDIFYRPATPFAASFIGMRNIYPVDFSRNTAVIDDIIITHTADRQGRGFLVIPPEVIVISLEKSRTSERNRFAAVVKNIEQGSTVFSVHLEIKGMEITASLTRGAVDEMGIKQGSSVYLSFKASAVHVF